MPLGKSRLDLKVEWRGGDELEKGKMTRYCSFNERCRGFNRDFIREGRRQVVSEVVRSRSENSPWGLLRFGVLGVVFGLLWFRECAEGWSLGWGLVGNLVRSAFGSVWVGNWVGTRTLRVLEEKS